MGIFGKQQIGIDLGTSTTIVYIARKGIALHQPSIVAIDKESNEIVAYGKEASKLVGRTSDRYEMIYPIRNGVIANFSMTKKMLGYFITQALNTSLSKPEVVISAPSQISKVERKAIIDAIKSLGINRAMIVEEAFVAALGADMAIEEARGKMIVDIGGGTTDIATLSYGEIVDSLTLSAASNNMNDEIQSQVRQEHDLMIGNYTAETLKIVIGEALFDPNEEDHLVVKGRHVVTGVPSEAKISSKTVAKAVDIVINQIIMGMKQVLELTPPELSADIMETGIVLTGGGSLLKHLPDRIQKEIGVPVRRANLPIDCVAMGAGRMFDELDRQSVVIERSLR
ncbi:rod shape-determining protein [Facklamia miroungae]|uniref:Cell shape-determining protein MreB n=1 Tax=Facklamia miroungae TaxID=120956 RepID=A0A1G7TVP3_9LACT|nr:rod shape-determining protein [Facklamia miroungae]NKZ29992.1 rod shape-determining protein [Facklamia miroungae]SDG39343.1 rod shape-determining protein MreB [Facklamia miroungae]